MVDIRQTVQYANYLSKIGWGVERVGEINYFIKKFPLVGSILKVQRPEEIRINKIRELSKKYRAFQIIIEPKTDFDAKFILSLSFKLSKSPYLPTKTLILELVRSEKELLKGMKKDARRVVGGYVTPDIAFYKYEKLNTMGCFHEVWRGAVGIKKYVPPLSHLQSLKKSFKDNALFLIYKDAGAIFLIADEIAYYWQAFNGKIARKNLYQYKIIWEGILWAQKNGAKIFDFEGIYDERFPNKSWLGFTHFKKSFGGYELKYPGTFVKWFL
jgi:hypothetical protein